MLGKGWFPDDVGGLDRYYRELLEHLPEAHGIVVGPASEAPDRVLRVSSNTASLPCRLFAVARAARRQRATVEVVDAHFALYAWWPVVVGSLRRRSLVVHFQGPWSDENVAAGDPSRFRRWARWRLERAVYRRASAVITLTEAFRRVAIERYGVAPWRTHVLRPGVDLERFSLGDRSSARAHLGVGDDEFVACCVRRLVPRMGIETLLNAWEDQPGSSRLLIAGDGPVRARLEALVAQSPGLGDRVCILGRVTEEDLLNVYRSADVNVVPTLSFEGFGLVVQEAAACGTPSIVSGVGGLPEAIMGAPGCAQVPPGDAACLRQALNEVRARPDSPGDRVSIRAWAATFGWEAVADRHRSVLRDVARRSPDPQLFVVAVHLDVGGVASVEMLAALSAWAHLHVIADTDGPLVDRLTTRGISVEVQKPGRVPVVRLARRLLQLGPDVVYVNAPAATIRAGLAARLTRFPVAWHRLDPAAPECNSRLFARRLATAVLPRSDLTPDAEAQRVHSALRHLRRTGRQERRGARWA